MYEVHALGYGEAHQPFHKDKVRVRKGPLIAVNSGNTTHQTFLYELSCALKVGKLDLFVDPLHNSITVTSAGVIKTSSTIVETCEQGEDTSIPKLTTVLIVRHSDWHPLVSASLSKIHKLVALLNPPSTTVAQ